MKYLVFSDTHFTERFDQRQFDCLINAISNVDKVIINGDFWDGYMTTFDKFLASEWNKLFPILRSKDSIYLHGNHDKKVLADERVSLFSAEQGDEFEFALGKQKVFIQHGNKLAPTLEDMHPKLFNNKLTYYLGDRFTKYGVFFGKRNFLKLYSILNRKMIKKWSFMKPHNILITGHSHYQETNPDQGYYNSGMTCRYFVEYTVIDTASQRITNQHEKLR